MLLRKGISVQHCKQEMMIDLKPFFFLSWSNSNSEFLKKK